MDQNNKSGKYIAVALAAAGAFLTTLVFLSDPSDPLFVLESALLAATTAASSALSYKIGQGPRKDDEE